MKERRDRIAETCQKYDIGKHKRRPGPADPTRDAPFPSFSEFFFYQQVSSSPNQITVSNRNFICINCPFVGKYSIFEVEYCTMDIRKIPLTYCPIYKAASTSWLWFMCRLAGVSDVTLRSKEMFEIARTTFPHITVPGEAQKVRLYYTFLSSR